MPRAGYRGLAFAGGATQSGMGSSRVESLPWGWATTSLYMYPGGIQARKKEKKKEKKNNRKEESLHKTLERAEGYSEIIHMGASGGVTSAQGTDSVLNHGESLIKHLRSKKHLR